MSNNLTLLSSKPQEPKTEEESAPKLSLLSSQSGQETYAPVKGLGKDSSSSSSNLSLLSSSPSTSKKDSTLSVPSSNSSGSSSGGWVQDSKPFTPKETPAITLPKQQATTEMGVAETALPAGDVQPESNGGGLAIAFIAVILSAVCCAAALFYLRNKSSAGDGAAEKKKTAPKAKAATRKFSSSKTASSFSKQPAFKKAIPEEKQVSASTTESTVEPVAVPSQSVSDSPSLATPAPAPIDHEAANSKIPSKPVPVDSSDPIIQFLNGEASLEDETAAASAAVAPAKPTAQFAPPRKPSKPGAVANGRPVPPPKPGKKIAAQGESQAPNAPTGLKAPAKPKKRF